ncbi:ABC transporter permease subunit [Clostridium sp. CM028]|uniref:ABC transporter permease subunit n=1 Tax=Clostridium sp. CM028 TaxID=2851575 RepID=UPI001C6F31B2|nr:ABC transporter permease subunit [Clostridium sp. CM028]MBW9148867.1 ABC transporter permease subunit [Clostridium sp. CM028]WLC63030.1 ABC transporter permease subunit [Clostridium sp. CM028]
MSKLFNLIKHELYKIYYKKSVLILLAVFVTIIILSTILTGGGDKAIEAKNLVKEYYKTGGNVTKLSQITQKEKEGLSIYTNIFNLEEYKTNNDENVAELQKKLNEMKASGITGYEYKSKVMELNMYKKVNENEKPYYLGFWGNINRISTSYIIPVGLLLLLCLGLSGVFSEEYSSGMDALILSSKYGKKTIITAKVLASCIYSSSVVLIFGITTILSSILYYGNIEGFDSPMQALGMYSFSPYQLNISQVYLLKFLMIFIGILAFGLLILMFSSRIRNLLVTFFVSFAAILIPKYLAGNMSLEQSKLGLINSYGYFISPSALLQMVNTYNIFGTPVINIFACGIALIIFSMISIYITKRSFRKHEVIN